MLEKLKELFHTPSYSRTILLIGVFFLLLSIPITVVFLGQKTNFFQHAMKLSPWTAPPGGGCEIKDWSACGPYTSYCSFHQDSSCKQTSNCQAVCGKCGYNGSNYSRPTSTCNGQQLCTTINGNTCSSYTTLTNCQNSSKCGYAEPKPMSLPDISCKSSSESGQCYANNSCGGGHEIIPNVKSCPSGYRICCAAGAPTPWYDCEKPGAMGGNIIKHTSTGNNIVANCDSTYACQNPTVNSIFISDGQNALSQAKSELCKTPVVLSTEAKTCVTNTICSNATNTISIWKGLNDQLTAILYDGCRNIYGSIPPLADFICNNGANIRNTIVLTISTGVINACKSEINQAITSADVNTLAEKICTDSCSSINVLPLQTVTPIGNFSKVMQESAISVCKTICPHFASLSTKQAQQSCNTSYLSSEKTINISAAQTAARDSVVNPGSQAAPAGGGGCTVVKTYNECQSGNPTACLGTGNGTTNNVPKGNMAEVSQDSCGNYSCKNLGPCNTCQNGKDTQFAINVKISGIGNNQFENNNPVHLVKTGKVRVYDASNSTGSITSSQQTFNFSKNNGKFDSATINVGNSLACSATYKVELKLPGFLPATTDVKYGDTAQVINLDPLPGDINQVDANGVIVGDGKIDINDYAIYRQCRNQDPNTPIPFKSNTTTVQVACGNLINFLDFPDGGTMENVLIPSSGIGEWDANYNVWLKSYIKANGY